MHTNAHKTQTNTKKGWTKKAFQVICKYEYLRQVDQHNFHKIPRPDFHQRFVRKSFHAKDLTKFHLVALP